MNAGDIRKDHHMEMMREDGSAVIFKVLTRPYQWDAPPFEGASFACLLVINDRTVKNEEQNELSDKLVKFGCRYAVFAGFNCSSWDCRCSHVDSINSSEE